MESRKRNGERDEVPSGKRKTEGDNVPTTVVESGVRAGKTVDPWTRHLSERPEAGVACRETSINDDDKRVPDDNDQILPRITEYEGAATIE